MNPQSKQAMLELFKTLSRELQETYSIPEAELAAALRPAEHRVPATAFANKLTPFETVCRYLSDQLSVEQIAKIVDRPPSVIEKTLRHSHAKQPEKLAVPATEHFVPATIFADKSHSFSEHLCLHLKREKLTNAQIGKLVGLDPRTVWTMLDRASKRGGKQ
jgi:hypothetical protein